MSVRIATNVPALAALDELGRNQQRLADASLALGSGSRITRSADDAAALTISQGLTTQINGMVQALANAHDATAVAAIADGALATVHDTLQRMRLLVLRAANTGSHGPGSLDAISREVGALTQLLNAIADFTASGGHTLLDGGYRAAFRIGAGSGGSVTLDLSQADMHADNLGGGSNGGGIDLTRLAILGLDDSDGLYSVDGMSADLATLSESIVAVSATRSDLGALANRLAYTVNDLGTAITAVTGSRSSLADADMAAEAQRLVAAAITTFAAASVAAQANSMPEAVLRLLDDSAAGSGTGRDDTGTDTDTDTDTGPGHDAGTAPGPGAATSHGPSSGHDETASHTGSRPPAARARSGDTGESATAHAA